VFPLLELESLPVKTLAKILGKIVSLIPSNVPLARVCTRTGYILLEAHTDSVGWFGSVTLTEQCRSEIRFFLSHCIQYNGYPIRTALTDVRIDSTIPNAIRANDTVHAWNFVPNSVIASDSSAFKAAILVLEGLDIPDKSLTFTFTDAEKNTSSGFRELLAIIKTLRHFEQVSVTNRNII
jgi:hypothetical protein